MLTNLYLFSHIAAGCLTLIAGPIAIIANRRHLKVHTIAGKVFYYAMLWVCFTSIVSLFRHPDQTFYQFLTGIGCLVLAGILRGVRAIQIMKNGIVKPFDFAYSLLLGATGLAMVSLSIYHYSVGTAMVFPILFAVFGVNCLTDVRINYKMFTQPANYAKMDWLRLHAQSMIGCLTASTTAFTVNTAHYLPWYIQWFGPTIVLLPLQIYWSKKLTPAKRQDLGKNTEGVLILEN